MTKSKIFFLIATLMILWNYTIADGFSSYWNLSIVGWELFLTLGLLTFDRK